MRDRRRVAPAASIFRNASNFRDPRDPFRKRARPENPHLPRPTVAAKIRSVRRTARNVSYVSSRFAGKLTRSCPDVSNNVHDGDAIPRTRGGKREVREAKSYSSIFYFVLLFLSSFLTVFYKKLIINWGRRDSGRIGKISLNNIQAIYTKIYLSFFSSVDGKLHEISCIRKRK